jgi:uncharacterized repeat protein (TIGR01451 family)
MRDSLQMLKNSGPNRGRRWPVLLRAWVLALALLAMAGLAHGYIIINAPMSDNNASGWTLGGNPNTARLTGTGNTAGGDDAIGSGWLRLTNNSGDQTGFAYNSTTFDLSAGLLVQFDDATWGGNGADGYSVFLFDAGVPTFNIGAFGGSLGYAQKLPPTVNPAVPGVSGGYVGIGVDEFGNFASGSEGRYQGTSFSPNTITVRGSVVGFGGGATGATSGTTSYPWIATSGNNGSLWYNGTTRPDQTSTNYRKVIISISPAPNPVLNAWVQFGYNTTPVQMVTNQALPAISASQQLQVGFGASTGSSTNYHEVRNLLITTLNQSTSIDLGITKTAVATGTSTPITSAIVGNSFQYQLVARNYGPNNITATGVKVLDSFPAGLTPGAWTCAVISGSPAGTSCGAASGTGNLNTTANLPKNGGVTYTLNATVTAAPPGDLLTNTASLGIPGAVIDYYPNDDSASSTITIYEPVKATKSFAPASVPTGTTSRMTVTLNNPNPIAATGVAFTDNYPSGLVNSASASRSATCSGATTSGANNGTQLRLTGATIPAGGSCTVSINTTSNTAGSYANSTGSITSTNVGTGTAATGTLVAMAPPTITKSFTPNQIGVGGTSLATITITNPNAAPITGTTFSDTYIAGLVNAANAGAATTCTDGTLAATNGGNTLALSGATVPAGGSCTVTVNVTSAASGSYVDPTGTVTTSNAGTGTSATATLTVLQAPTVAQSFTPATVLPGASSTLTVTLTNPNTTAITGAAFSESYTSGLFNAAAATGSTTCSGGTVTAAGGGNSLALSGATIPASGSCTVTISTTASSAGSYTNSTGPLTTTNAGSAAAASATLNVMAPPNAAMLFTPSSIGIGGVSQLKVTLANPNAIAITGAAFSDSYPGNMVNTASASGTSSCGGTVTAANNGASLALTGATIPAGGSCTVTVNVTVTATGAFANSTGPITTTNAGTGSAATASLNGPQPPTVGLSFTPSTILLGAASQLVVTLTNPNAVAVTGAAFNDSYPAGLANTASAAAATTCTGATVTAANNGTSLTLSGATIPAGGSCTVTVNVTSAAAGSYTDSTGAVSTGNAGSAAAASGTLVVMAPLTTTMSFSPASVLVNTPSVLTVTLSNPNTTTAVTGVAFSDSYPAGLVNSASAGAATTCSGASVTAANGGSSLALAGASIPAGGSCSVTVNVTSASAGSYSNSTGPVSTGNAGSGTAGSATLTATLLSAPTVTKSFGPTQIPVNTTSLQTITLTNTSATTVTGVTLSDSYPAGLKNAAAAAAATTCPGGSVTAANGGSSLTLSGASIPGSGSCTVTVNVTSNSAGSYLNSTGGVTSSNAVSAAAASATLAVLNPPTAALSFAPASVLVNTSSLLTVTLTNPNSTAISTASFTSSYPSGLVNAASASPATTCSGGVVTAANGGNSLALAGASIPASGSCTVTVSVTSASAGNYLTSTGAVSTGNAGSGSAASATLSTTLLPAPTVVKSFTPNQVVVNGTASLSVTLTNPSATAISGVTLTDTFPTTPGQMIVASGSSLSNSCGGTATIAANKLSFTLTGGSIPAGGSCALSVGVSAPTIGSYSNTTSTVTSANAVTAAAASAVLTVAPMTAPSAVLVFTPNQIGVNGVSVLKVTLSNPNAVAITGVGFTDSYPSGLVNAASALAATTCGGTVTASNNGSSLALSGASIPASGSCTVTVNVTGTSAGSYLSSTGAISTGNAGSGSAASATLSVLLAPTVSLQFTPAMNLVNSTSQLTVTLSNPNSIAITGAAFSDSYPSGLLNTTPASGATTCVSGAVTAPVGGGSLTLSGATIAGNGSCTVTVNVSSASAGNYLDSTGPVSTSNAGSGAAASATLVMTLTPVRGFTKSASTTTSAPGQLVTYTDVINNPSTGHATSVVLSGILSPYAYWGINSYGAGVSFLFTEGTPASGLTLGTPVYSKDGGATWGYLPASGAGGAPAGYDGLVTNWQIPMSGIMNPAGRFTLNYKTLLK